MGEIIAKHKSQPIGARSSRPQVHGHDFTARHSGQTADVYALFARHETAICFLDEIVARYLRYIRDQFQIIRELASYIDVVTGGAGR